MPSTRLNTPLEALEYVNTTLARYPERQVLPVRDAARTGSRRKYSGLYLNYLSLPDDTGDKVNAIDLPAIETPPGPDGELTRDIAGLLEPLKMLNPVTLVMGLGKGTGTLVSCFGTPLVAELGHTPAYTLSLEEALKRPAPEAQTAGLMPEMRARIEFIKSRLPAGKGLCIGLPDMQGPFNLAHAVLGEDALIGPYTSPDLYHEFMVRMADFWADAWRTLRQWIGPEWLAPEPARRVHIAQCSVNLVAPEFYREFILPYDLRALQALAMPLSIHPCSGPHVFHETLERLPNVVETEAGAIDKTAAGSIKVDDALRQIGSRPITLHIGQELPAGSEYEFIRRDFDRYADHPRLTFGYTGMHWRIRDRARIHAMHRKLDEYWADRYGA